MSKGKLLHIGCGSSPLPDWLRDYTETRLDIDAECNPDIVAPMWNLGDIGEYDAIYTCHALEHVFPKQVKESLNEFFRVLKSGGFCIIFVPDLTNVKPDSEPLYESPAGWICGHDMYYGKESFVECNPFMAHKTGFTNDSLISALNDVGFSKVKTHNATKYDLMGVAVK
jgi:SAM-dependent methyltransferase